MYYICRAGYGVHVITAETEQEAMRTLRTNNPQEGFFKVIGCEKDSEEATWAALMNSTIPSIATIRRNERAHAMQAKADRIRRQAKMAALREGRAIARYEGNKPVIEVFKYSEADFEANERAKAIERRAWF